VTPLADASTEPPARGVRVSFVLSKGGFATTVLARACRVADASLGLPRAGGAEGEGDDVESPSPEE
jgi:hypothetical protein